MYMKWMLFPLSNVKNKSYKLNLQKYLDDINEAKIYKYALDESIDLTLNYFNEIKNYLKENQNNLYNINYNLTEKYYNDFRVFRFRQ